MDTVFITGINASTTIGVYDRERGIKQSLLIDLELGCDTRVAGRSDSFTDAIDYDAIARRTLALTEAASFYLIEAVAEHICDMLFSEFSVQEARVKITKPGAVDIAEAVGVIVVRTRGQRS